jgi:hypothetical protein
MLPRQRRALALPQNVLEHIAGTKEVRADFEKTDGGLHGCRVTSENSLERSLETTREPKRVNPAMELCTGILPFTPFLRTQAPQCVGLVYPRMEPDYFGSIVANCLPDSI